jgi:hypothetical protein
MSRKTNGWMFLALVLVALSLTTACSLNRQLPKEADEEAMVVEVRSAIAAAVPNKTFSLKVDVTEGGRVTLSGHPHGVTEHGHPELSVRDDCCRFPFPVAGCLRASPDRRQRTSDNPTTLLL